MRYDVVLWDFDGTLVDSSEGILRSMRLTFKKMGLTVPGREVLEKFIGPPLMYSLQSYTGLGEEQAREAVRLYREVYETEDIYRSQVYPGMESLIRRLRAQGVKIGVATLKPEWMAQLLLKHFGIGQLVDTCSGSASDELGERTKSQIIDEALRRLGHTDRSRVVMLGDTLFDADGAKESGVDFVAAMYGFGLTEQQAKDAGSVAMVRGAEDLTEFFFGRACQTMPDSVE